MAKILSFVLGGLVLILGGLNAVVEDSAQGFHPALIIVLIGAMLVHFGYLMMKFKGAAKFPLDELTTFYPKRGWTYAIAFFLIGIGSTWLTSSQQPRGLSLWLLVEWIPGGGFVVSAALLGFAVIGIWQVILWPTVHVGSDQVVVEHRFRGTTREKRNTSCGSWLLETKSGSQWRSYISEILDSEC